jgi:hypothetical protein
MDWRERRQDALYRAEFAGRRVADYLLGTGD